MRIKSVVSKEAPAVMPKPYPKLMISDGGSVVYFTSESRGVLIAVGSAQTSNPLEFHNSWLPSGFTDFDGSVTLTVSND